jgi:hypothetical protein
MCPVRVQGTFALGTGRQSVNEKFGSAARGNFKMQVPSARIFP